MCGNAGRIGLQEYRNPQIIISKEVQKTKKLLVLLLSAEKKIWAGLELDPTENPNYIESGQGMGATLTMTNEMNAYCMSDRGTWLKQYGVIAVNPEKMYMEALGDDIRPGTEMINVTDALGRITSEAVAAQVAGGEADCGVGVYSAAHAMGLDFIPAGEEEYDFVMRKESLEMPEVQCFLRLLGSEAFRSKLEELGGYSLEDPVRIMEI